MQSHGNADQYRDEFRRMLDVVPVVALVLLWMVPANLHADSCCGTSTVEIDSTDIVPGQDLEVTVHWYGNPNGYGNNKGAHARILSNDRTTVLDSEHATYPGYDTCDGPGETFTLHVPGDLDLVQNPSIWLQGGLAYPDPFSWYWGCPQEIELTVRDISIASVTFVDDDDSPTDDETVTYVSADIAAVDVVATVEPWEVDDTEVKVYWAISQGPGGSLSATESITDGGYAHTLLRTSRVPGARYKVSAGFSAAAPNEAETERSVEVVPGRPYAFTYEIWPAGGSGFVPLTLNAGSIPAEFRMAADDESEFMLRVTAKDQYDNLVADGTEVEWELFGDGEIVDDGSTSDSTVDGQAVVKIRAGPHVNKQLLFITIGDKTVDIGNPMSAVTIDLTQNAQGGFDAQARIPDGSGGWQPVENAPIKWYISKGSISIDENSGTTMVEGTTDANGLSTATVDDTYRNPDGTPVFGRAKAFGNVHVVCTIGNTSKTSEPFEFNPPDTSQMPFIYFEDAFLNGERTENATVDHETYSGETIRVPMKAKGQAVVVGAPGSQVETSIVQVITFENAAYWPLDTVGPEGVCLSWERPFECFAPDLFISERYPDSRWHWGFCPETCDAFATNLEVVPDALDTVQGGSLKWRVPIEVPVGENDCWTLFPVQPRKAPYSSLESFNLSFWFKPQANEIWLFGDGGVTSRNWAPNSQFHTGGVSLSTDATGKVLANVRTPVGEIAVLSVGQATLEAWNSLDVTFVYDRGLAEESGDRRARLELTLTLNGGAPVTAIIDHLPVAPADIPFRMVGARYVIGPSETWCVDGPASYPTVLRIDEVHYDVAIDQALNFNFGSQFAQQATVTTDEEGKAYLDVASAGALQGSSNAWVRVAIHASYLDPQLGLQEFVTGVFLLNDEFQARLEELLRGIAWGEGTGAEGFVGDLVAGMLFYGDARDIVKNLAFLAPGGNEADWVEFSLATAGLAADFTILFLPGESANLALAFAKAIVKKLKETGQLASAAGKALSRFFKDVIWRADAIKLVDNKPMLELFASAESDLLTHAASGMIRNEVKGIDNLHYFAKNFGPNETAYKAGLEALSKVARDFDPDTARQVAQLLRNASVPWSDDALAGLATVIKTKGAGLAVAERMLKNTARGDFGNKVCEQIKKIAEAVPATKKDEFAKWLREGPGIDGESWWGRQRFRGAFEEADYAATELLKPGGRGLSQMGHTAPDGRPGRDAIDGLGDFIENKHWFPTSPSMVAERTKNLEAQLASHIERIDKSGSHTIKFVFRGSYRQEWVDALERVAVQKDFPLSRLEIEFRELDPIF